MTYKLSQIDRTLLSAYLDGEVSPAERMRAEGLLKGSEEAVNYLRDLQAVNYLSGAAIAVPTVGAGASAGISAKLTGSAIQAAAKRAMVTKASSALGSWGIAGLASATAALVVGVALTMNTPSPGPDSGNNKKERITAGRSDVVPAALDIDTSNLLVPPMTTSDLYAFALHGTLPLGAKRDRFITCSTRGGDSLQVKVHSKAPEDIAPDMAAIAPREAHALDSLQRVIRTSVIHYANGGVALRADIPQVRLAAIRTLEQVAPRLTREKLDRTRMQLAEAERTLRQLPSTRSPFEGAGGSTMGGTVSYMVIYPDPMGISEWNSDMLPQDQFVVRVDGPSFTVDQGRLGSLQARMRLPIPPTPPPVFEEDMQAPAMVSSGAGSRVKPKVRRPSSDAMGEQEIEQSLQEPSRPEEYGIGDGYDDQNLDSRADEFVREWMGRHGSAQDLRVIIEQQDSILRHSRMMIDSASRSVHRVDSMLNRVRVRYREWNNGGGGEGANGHGGKQSVEIVIHGNGTTIWNGMGTSGDADSSSDDE